jgi:uncharacterized membrane protein YfcA
MKILIIIALFGIVQLINFMRGGSGFKSILDLKRCSTSYWLMSAALPIITIICSILVKIYLKREEDYKKFHNYEFDSRDMKIDWKNIITISSSAFISGIITGMLGVGAGLINMPILLFLGIRPRVAAATSGFMYLIISGTSII